MEKNSVNEAEEVRIALEDLASWGDMKEPKSSKENSSSFYMGERITKNSPVARRVSVSRGSNPFEK